MPKPVANVPRTRRGPYTKRAPRLERRTHATAAATATASPRVISIGWWCRFPQKVVSASRLPPELLHAIFAHLANDQPALSRASLVCRQWHALALPHLYRHPRLTSLAALSAFMRVPGPSGKLVRELDLSRVPLRERYVTDAHVDRLVSLCPNLLTLNVSGCALLHDHTLRLITRVLGRTLEALDVSQCAGLTNTGLLALASGCAALRSLDVSYDAALTEIAACSGVKWINQYYGLVAGLNFVELRRWCKELCVEWRGQYDVVREEENLMNVDVAVDVDVDILGDVSGTHFVTYDGWATESESEDELDDMDDEEDYRPPSSYQADFLWNNIAVS